GRVRPTIRAKGAIEQVVNRAGRHRLDRNKGQGHIASSIKRRRALNVAGHARNPALRGARICYGRLLSKRGERLDDQLFLELHNLEVSVLTGI
ncbi:hypothetical protein ABTF05_20845, partial [Acinetobacter baumannii]